MNKQDRIALLAHKNNGAIQVDDAMDEMPLLVVLAGPIKFWWTTHPDGTQEWGSERHVAYTTWRDAVEAAVVQDGHLAYKPHTALRGSWNEAAQRINDAAIQNAHALLVMTPDGIPAEGTAMEQEVARAAGTPIIYAPPAGEADLDELLAQLAKMREQLRD